MKRFIRSLPVAFLILGPLPASGAKYAGDFMYLGIGGRPISLGGAYVASAGDIMSSYYNPAGIARIAHPQAMFMHSETFGSLLNHDFLAYSRPLGSGEKQAAMAISLYRLGGGGIIVTSEDQTGQIRKVSEESHADYVGYFSYGRGLGSKLSAGISAKLIYRRIVDESAFGLGLDMGAIYNLTRWADVGVNLQDIPSTLLSYTTGANQRVNPTAKTGTVLRTGLGDFTGSLFADVDMRFEGRRYASQAHFGRISLDTHIGVEAVYKSKLSARVGSDAGNLTLGAGLRLNRFIIDMAIRDHSDLDNTFLASIIMQM